MAEKLDVSANTVSTWKKRGIPSEILVKTSRETGYSLCWIETGEGEMRPGGATNKTDQQTMRAVIEAVEEHLQAEDKQLPPAKKAERGHHAL